MLIFMIALIVVLSFSCGFVSAWTGQGGNKMWRRLAVPAVSSLFGILAIGLWQIFIMARAGSISMGYGIPDKNDKGSVLGAFWYKIFGGDVNDPSKDPHQKASIFTRGTIGVMEAVGIISIPIQTGHWFTWMAAAFWLVFNNIYWGAIEGRETTFEFKGRKMLWEEFAIEGIDTFIILTLIMVSMWK